MKNKIKDLETYNKDFYIATKDLDGKFLIYESDKFRLSELDLITLIKICLIESRSKIIGRKILEAYRDSTNHRKEITSKRLSLIGINGEKEEKPTKRGIKRGDLK